MIEATFSASSVRRMLDMSAACMQLVDLGLHRGRHPRVQPTDRADRDTGGQVDEHVAVRVHDRGAAAPGEDERKAAGPAGHRLDLRCDRASHAWPSGPGTAVRINGAFG